MKWMSLGLAAMLAAVALAPAQPAPVMEKQQFLLTYNIETTPLLGFIGPGVKEAMSSDPRGVRINLPVPDSDMQSAGIRTKFQLHGDFEVTAAYVLVSAGKPPPASGAGVRLGIDFDTPGRAASVARQTTPKGERFRAALKGKSPDGKASQKLVPATKTEGWLRLTRRGSTLTYSVAEAPGAFQEIHSEDAGAEDIKQVRLACFTGNSVPVTAILSELTVESAKLPNQSRLRPQPAASPWPLRLATGAVVIVLLGAAWWGVRRWRRMAVE